MSKPVSDRRGYEEPPPGDGGGGWINAVWGLAVVVIGFVAIQASRHFTDTTERQALLDKGVSVNLVIHSCVEEYAGQPYGDLSLTKQAADIESVVTIGGKSKTTRRKSDDGRPNQDAGEADRCRLVFDDEGRAFLNGHQQFTVGGPDALAVTTSYEVEVVEGSRADYEAGRPIRLVYKQESLEKRRDDLRKSLALQWLPILRREVPGDSTMNFNVKCVVEPLPQSSMRATPSSLFIEDVGPVKATITVTVSER